MMDKKPHIKPYLYGMLAGFGAIALSIIFFFLIYRFDGFGSAISTLTGILMPFLAFYRNRSAKCPESVCRGGVNRCFKLLCKINHLGIY